MGALRQWACNMHGTACLLVGPSNRSILIYTKDVHLSRLHGLNSQVRCIDERIARGRGMLNIDADFFGSFVIKVVLQLTAADDAEVNTPFCTSTSA
jgi:hypothetical protein